MALSNIMRNFAVFVDGVAKLGDGSEAMLPSPNLTTEDYRGGGMFRTAKVPLAGEPLEARLKFTSFDPDVLAKVGRLPGNEVPFTVRGSLSQSGQAPTLQAPPVVPVIARMLALINESDLGSWVVGQKSEYEMTLHVYRYKLSHGDRVIYDIDVWNMIEVRDGVDIMANDRTALGLT